MSITDPPSAEAIRSLVRTVRELAEFEGRDELLAQADEVEYADGPLTMSRLRVGSECPAAPNVANPVPSSPAVCDANGEAIGGLLLWLDKRGYLDCLEYWWVTDEMPTQLPSPNQVRGS